MTEQDLWSLLDEFYSAGFDVLRAISRLGEARSRGHWTISLAPRDPGVDSIDVELPRAGGAESEAPLVGLIIRLKAPLDIDVEHWEHQLGAPRRMPHSEASRHRRYQFRVRGGPVNGYVLLRILDDDMSKPRVDEVILRRFIGRAMG